MAGRRRSWLRPVQGAALVAVLAVGAGWLGAAFGPPLPVSVEVHLARPEAGAYKLYVDAGRGFGEADAVARVVGKGVPRTVLSFPLPATGVQALRLDPEPVSGRLRLRAICLASLARRHCRPAAELAGELVPLADIRELALRGADLVIETGPGDPSLHLGDYPAAWKARVSRWPWWLGAVPVTGVALLAMIVWADRRHRRARGLCLRPGISRGEALGLVAMTLLFASGTWLGFDRLGRVPLVMLGALLVVPAFVSTGRDVPLSPRRESFPQLARWSAAVAAALLPVVVFLLLTWNQEFPNLGDHDYHLTSTAEAAYLWRAMRWLVIGYLLSAVAAMLLGLLRYWLLVMLALLIVLGADFQVPDFLLRYPGTGRFLAAPVMELAAFRDWNHLLDAPRLVSALSVVAWLALLRPLVVGRAPDAVAVLVAVAVMMQAQVVYYVTSAYLEPWALVFVLLGAELVLVDCDRESCLRATVLAGVAAMFKEQAILVLPWFWLASRPWQGDWRARGRSLLVALAAAAPFAVYLQLRAGSGTRGFTLVSWQELTDPVAAGRYAGRILHHFGVGDLILVAVLVAAACTVAWRVRRLRLPVAVVIGAAVTQAAFFYVDRQSRGFPGHPRLLLLAFALLAVLVVVVSAHRRGREPRVVAAICAAVLLAHLSPLAALLFRAAGPDPARNFSEEARAPIYLSVETLASRALRDGHLAPGTTVRIFNPTGYHLGGIPLHYQGLFRHLRPEISDEMQCGCRAGGAALLVPLVHYAGVNAGLDNGGAGGAAAFPGGVRPPPAYVRRWQGTRARAPACRARMQRTCAQVYEERVDGELAGLLGVPPAR